MQPSTRFRLVRSCCFWSPTNTTKGLSQIRGVDGSSGIRPTLPRHCRRRSVILNAIAEKLKRRSKDDFKGRHFEASLILQTSRGICAIRSATAKLRNCFWSVVWRRPNPSSVRCCGISSCLRPIGSVQTGLAFIQGRKEGLLPQDPVHYISKYLQQGIESDHSHGHVRGQG
jgi:hypothetical protein